MYGCVVSIGNASSCCHEQSLLIPAVPTGGLCISKGGAIKDSNGAFDRYYNIVAFKRCNPLILLAKI